MSMPLIDDDLAVACSLSSPLAKLGKVKLSQLKDEKFILLDQKYDHTQAMH